jgi:FkbM family methyltransferase
MSIPFFLYRRLAKFITCELNLGLGKKITLQNKYEVASFKDVFCHPFYWQVFQFMHRPPALVVDCGAHCGHFTVLSDVSIASKFGASATDYLLIEPNPYLLPTIQKNIKEAGITNRVKLTQGLLGAQAGTGELWINPKNFLATGMQPCAGAKPHAIPFVNLQELVGDRTIDLMKLDIEGGEFDLIESSLDVFKQVNLLFMELHEASPEQHQRLYTNLQSVGLYPAALPISCHGQQLVILQRVGSSPDYLKTRLASQVLENDTNSVGQQFDSARIYADV